MVQRLPPLNAVRAFDAAARHLSFTRAAEDLNVTQAAVSHQVKALEDWLGEALFRRLNRALELTPIGALYARAVADGLNTIADATASVMDQRRSGALTISTLPSFASRWLLPRLSRFQSAHPDIEVRLSSSQELTNFSSEDVDLAIRFGRGLWTEVQLLKLMDERIFPICSPDFIDRYGPFEHPKDLANVPLLHDDFLIDWEAWLKTRDIDGVDWTKGPRFTDSTFVIQMALDGHGVGLGRDVLIVDELAAGRLIALFDTDSSTEFGYYLVAPSHHFARPKVRAFRDWIVDEIARAKL